MEYIAPIAVSWITCAHALLYDETRFDISYRIIKMAVAYFIGDAIYIIINRKKEYYGFIIHHALAAYIGICGYIGYINLHILSIYFIVFEFSNLFLNIWSLTNKLKTYTRVSYISFPLTVCTYVPSRTIILPIVSYYIFLDSWIKGYYGLCSIYIALIGLSFWYSYILLKIAFKKLPIYGLDGVKACLRFEKSIQ